MAFSVNVAPTRLSTSRSSFKGSQSATNTLIVIAVIFAAFCVYDYSPYGHGIVADLLGQSQRWVRYMVGQFRLKM